MKVGNLVSWRGDLAMDFIPSYNFYFRAYLLFMVISLVFSPHSFASESLVQDLTKLQSSNGKIVSQKKVPSYSGCSSSSRCYKIVYLSDGLEIAGYIVIPKKVPGKLPVLIFNRGGNRDFGKLTNKSLKYLSYLSSNGFIVLASQYRGVDGGEGKDQFGGEDIKDVLNLMPLAHSLAIADADNTVMLGFSRGGMMTYLAIKNGIKIKAAAVVGGATDLEQTYEERDKKMKRLIRELVGNDKQEWRNRSAYYWPEKINVPVLILHGGKDWRVKDSQARKLAKKLEDHGKEYKLTIIPEGDHGLNKHRRKRNSLIFNWFNSHLK
ncbi:MAG: prolyl oligopeptidase family serine peptidase [Sedimenticola sp.]